MHRVREAHRSPHVVGILSRGMFDLSAQQQDVRHLAIQMLPHG